MCEEKVTCRSSRCVFEIVEKLQIRPAWVKFGRGAKEHDPHQYSHWLRYHCSLLTLLLDIEPQGGVQYSTIHECEEQKANTISA